MTEQAEGRDHQDTASIITDQVVVTDNSAPADDDIAKCEHAVGDSLVEDSLSKATTPETASSIELDIGAASALQFDVLVQVCSASPQ